jgi:hypothetical protein
LELARELGIPRHEAVAHREMARVHLALENYDAAREQLGSALELWRQLGNTKREAELRQGLAERGDTNASR